LTRRLDYTYYNLLEKITALNSTIGLFQELSDSASNLLNDFERETAGLDQEIRKQINDLKGFQPQIQKADALDERMKKGRQRVEELGKRLEAVRQQIDSWEERETEWQTRISRRLRIFWGIVCSAFLVLVLALVVQNWPTISSPHNNKVPVPVPTELTELAKLANESSAEPAHLPNTWESLLGVHDPANASGMSWYPSSLAERRQSLEDAQATPTASARTSSRAEHDTTEHDPLRLLDEL
jgi:tetrahydromethanopterin S-methyltransferase subunit B